MSSLVGFREAIALEVEKFSGLKVISRVAAGDVSIADYHRVLIALFHQVRNSSSSFSLAAATCQDDRYEIKSYLMHHADEEKDHWQWILDDLRATNYDGPSPISIRPHWTAAAYVAYNYHVASTYPLGRLGIAAMLETVAARLGETLALRLCRALGLTAGQASFFMSHGITDKKHERELFDVLEKAELHAGEWDALAFHASVAGELYRRIYQELG